MRSKLLIITIITVSFFTACSKKDEPQNVNSKTQEVKPEHEVVVEEVIQVKEYTYLRVKEGNNENWIAAPKADIKIGDVLLYNKSMEMKNFESKELKRKFESILFVDDLSQKLGAGIMTQPQKPAIEKEAIKVDAAREGITIAQLFANPSSYSGKVVRIKGKVIKVNTGIMKHNWIHIQDGTSSGNDFDLTITTNEFIKVGDVLTFEGKISLNKNFGFGYSYKVLMEDAVTHKEI